MKHYQDLKEGSEISYNCTIMYVFIYVFMYVCMYVFISRGDVVVKALPYKPSGHGFDSRSVIGIFQ
jgi:hypothetical protein